MTPDERPAHDAAAGTDVIRTPDQRIRVFVSSTLGELAAERAAVRAAIERLHLTPVLFELGARSHAPTELYRAYLRQSHVFIGLYAQRYGWVAPGESASGLDDELSRSDGMPRLLYVKQTALDADPRLREMLDSAAGRAGASYRSFGTPAELAQLVEEDLAVLLSERFVAGGRAGAGRDDARRASAPPVPLTPTVGREEDVAAVAALLADGVRLITITGPGGIGKSRLALEVARVVDADFPGGVTFVPLEDERSRHGVLQALAARLRVVVDGTLPVVDALVERLGDRRSLLILDNMEQVAAAATDVGAVLDRCPGVAALVTSRHVLHLRAEHEYPLAPLAVPEDAEEDVASVPAVRLFVQRAAAARPDFRLTAANRDAVARLTRRLDGLPLAIELAAARTRLFPPAALHDRLERRLDLPGQGAGDLPGRQRTLRTTFDWSYDLLSPSEQVLFTRTGVFAGGATLDALEAIAGDHEVPDVLGAAASLVEKSLLISEPADGTAGPRFRMLRTVRAYAETRLEDGGGADDVRRRHARWYADLVAPADPLRFELAVRHWPVLETEAANLRAAVVWAIGRREDDLVVALMECLWPWLWASGRLGELRDLLDRALPDRSVSASARGTAALCFISALTRGEQGDLAAAVHLADQALEHLETCEEPDTPVLAAATRLTRWAWQVGTDDGFVTRDDLDHAVDVGHRLDNAWLIAYATSIRGALRASLGDLAGARQDEEESLAVARRMEHPALVPQALGQLTMVRVLEGAWDDARRLLIEQLDALRDTGHLEGLGYALDNAAALASRHGHWESAARAVTAATDVRAHIGLPVWPVVRRYHEETLDAVRDHFGSRLEEVVASARRADPWSVADEVLRDIG